MDSATAKTAAKIFILDFLCIGATSLHISNITICQRKLAVRGRYRCGCATEAAMASGSITLDQVAAHITVLAVACSRCDRAGQYGLDTLIARHGPGFGVPELLRLLSADCPKRHSLIAYDLCGVHCPDLPTFFRP
jgi:hypothetical protein